MLRYGNCMSATGKAGPGLSLQEAYPDDWQARLKDLVNFQVPGGESLQDAADRIRPTLRKILKKHRGW